GDPMGDTRPLFSTFKPIGKDNTASAKLEPERSPVQLQGAEQPLGHPDTQGRVGHGAAMAPSPQGPCPSWSPPEGDLPPELVALRARTRLWFEQTQARRLRSEGELPAWFHGFLSRRETERLLQDQPLGCYLVRFSESTVGFVLSYRGRDRCRHFVLDQLPDGHYVILGEPSAHAELPDLLRHYSLSPVTPYHEFLTVPHRRRGRSPTSNPLPCPVPSLPQAPSVPPPLPAKGSSSATAPGGAAPEGPYGRVHEEAPPLPTPPDAKYQQLLCFHTYAEPHEARGSGEGDEPIPFYAMGRGSSPNPEENVYSEV
ncbi:SH22A protein, partial [Halcyon senegalensis]|nr:SH22A protein [Halcyon senegalensis]